MTDVKLPEPVATLCFRAAERGLLVKTRVNCGRYIFSPSSSTG